MGNGDVEGLIAKRNRRDLSVNRYNASGPHAGDALARRQIINRYLPRHNQKITPETTNWPVL
jgi:hypothetical protein